MNIKHCFEVFNEAISLYHERDDIEFEYINPYEEFTLDYLLFKKAYIDTIQWHCEDVVRDPTIEDKFVRYYKVKIDDLNQKRTNLVEKIDDYFLETYKNVILKPSHRLNTESPAWALDRLCILALKLYHMNIEVTRQDLSSEKREEYQQKFDLLIQQREDLIQALESLLDEIGNGETHFKVYRQVKMYNDKDLNPILRQSNAK